MCVDTNLKISQVPTIVNPYNFSVKARPESHVKQYDLNSTMILLAPPLPLDNAIIEPYQSYGKQPNIPYPPPMSSGYGRTAHNGAPTLADPLNHHKLGTPAGNT